MRIMIIAAFISMPLVAQANANLCGSHEVKKVDVDQVSTLTAPVQKVVKSVLPNMVRFSEKEGSGFVLSKVDHENSLMLTASHVARTLIHGTDRKKMRIGFPIPDSNLPPASDAQVGFLRNGTLDKYYAQRLYTPSVEFNPTRERVYEQVLKPNLDFTLMKVKNEKLGADVNSLSWDKPHEGQKVVIIGRGMVSTGCIDQLYPDQTFDMDANVVDGMSGGIILDAETGKVIGVLTTGFTDGGKDDGSGGVSIQTMVDHIEGKRKDSFLAEHFEKTKVLEYLKAAAGHSPNDVSKANPSEASALK